MDDLQKVLEEADFAVLVATPDDMVTSRGKEQSAPRDNVVFELGLVIGALSRSRSFLLCGRGVDMKLPTDLLGLTPLEYDADASVALSDRIAPVANDLREIILKKGTR
jgi:predicted nucleotide-binding protein